MILNCKNITNRILTISLLTLTALFSYNSLAATKYINVATAGITGVYYPAGGAICRLVNRGRKEHGIRCSVESTGGSVANINAIRSGIVEFGISQSDWQYHSYKGSGFFADQTPFKDLRSVFSLYTETFTIIAREDSGIDDLDDIKGKVINFGPKDSGVHATMEVILKAKEWERDDFAKITHLTPSDQIKSLCDGDIDVMTYMAGNPNGVVQEVTQHSNIGCKVKIINIDDDTINKLIKINPSYVKSYIAGGMYKNNPEDISTFGIKATLVTSSKIGEDVVYNLTKAVFDNFDNFKTLHPVFASMKINESVKDGNHAPIHKGALRYYKESKLIN
ncbi:TAXI family TRAP transporter solute-binding subunit [Rickettsiales bacterium]|nr:TAXI family TRAP transporter solute-binding subunit [Rickettsiales bacterium]MDB2550489.1 TAXI family TRAP transporter solute-binding subunit [Rickettsiales bacterium]